MRARSTLVERSASGQPFVSQPFVSLALATVVLAAAVLLVLAPLGDDAEVRYLALWIAAVVAVVALLAPRPGVEAALGALFAVTVVWVVPPLPATRGIVVGVLLTAVFVGAAVRRLRGLGRSWVAPATWVALALGAQLLLRSALLIEPLTSARTLVALFALPGVVGLACWCLARVHGWRRVLVAAVGVTLLGPGFRVAGTLTLVAFAAAGVAFDRAVSRPLRLLALAVTFAPILWEPRTGALIVAAAIALAGPRIFALLIGALALPATLLPGAAQGWSEVLGLFAWLPLLLPAWVLPARERKPTLLAAGALAVLCARQIPVAQILQSSAFVAPLALAALSVRRGSVALRAQVAWSAVLFTATAVLAAYPWLRLEPLADAVGLLGIVAGPEAALAALGLCGLIFLLDRFSTAPSGDLAGQPQEKTLLLNRPVACVLVATLLAIACSLPKPAQELRFGRELVFNRDRGQAQIELRQTLSGLAIESRLTNAATLAHGTPVATLALTDSQGAVYRYTLKAGRDTGEWAARRADVARLPLHAAPPPWRCRVHKGGTFFTQSYRTVWDIRATSSGERASEEKDDGPLSITRLQLTRNPDLPPEVALVLTRLEYLP